MKHLVLFLFLLPALCQLYAQSYTGTVRDQHTGLPIGYVNIGVVNKNTGTVSNAQGRYTLTIGAELDSDSLRFSCIGYTPFSIKVADFRQLKSHDITLGERIVELAGVVVRPKVFRQRTFGVTSRSKAMRGGFEQNELGYECGILMKNKRPAHLQRVNIRFASCSYDTIFYRLNIYNAQDEGMFVPLLTHAIYLQLPKEKVLSEVVTVDLAAYDLWAEGNFLVTLEHVKDLGSGFLLFSMGLGEKTWYRKTSQGQWMTAPFGVSISVDARVEK